jgi:DNA-binding NtrC family response regulator
MSGLEMLRRIKTIDATVPVIVITAVDAVRHAAEAFKLGAREYLVKPLDVTCMLEVVREAMASPPLSLAGEYPRARALHRAAGGDESTAGA